MRNVYCKTESVEESKKCARGLASRFARKGLEVEMNEDTKIEFKCNGYDIWFLDEKQWLTFTTTKAGTGYLTIPYNRILISPHGVPQDDCRLVKLVELVEKGFK